MATAGCGTALRQPALPLANVARGRLSAQVESALKLEFARWDRDGDGFVTRKELPGEAIGEFDTLDRDRDGRLSFAEGIPADGARVLEQTWAKLPAERGRAFAGNGSGSGAGPDGTRGQGGRESSVGSSNSGVGQVLGSHSGLDTGTDLRALGWWDFLRGRRDPAPPSPVGRRPILLVPGYFEPGAMWLSFQGELRGRGWTQIYIYEHWPGFSDIRSMAAKAGALADRIRQETGFEQIDVVGHSMGGLVLRYWIQRLGGAAKIAHYVSMATPHKGTYMGYFGPGMSAVQLRPGSEFLNDLNSGDTLPGNAHYASIWSRTDEIVVPQPNGRYDGASDTPFPIAEHLQLAWLKAAQDVAIEELSK